MLRPLIGITPQYNEQSGDYKLRPYYMQKVLEAGGIPMMLPITTEPSHIQALADRCDGFLFSGGPDFSPEFYGEEMLECCGDLCPPRDDFEPLLMKAVLERGKPMLCICRGMQLLNVMCGGTLYQDIAALFSDKISHRLTGQTGKCIHQIDIRRDTPLFSLLGKEQISVNSYHHQGVKHPGDDLQIMATSQDGLIEGICLPQARFVWGVQWHPEMLEDENSVAIFRKFIEAVNK